MTSRILFFNFQISGDSSTVTARGLVRRFSTLDLHSHVAVRQLEEKINDQWKRFALRFSETTRTRVRDKGLVNRRNLALRRYVAATASQHRERVWCSNRWYELRTSGIWMHETSSCLIPKLAFAIWISLSVFMAEDWGIEDRWVETSSGNVFW